MEIKGIMQQLLLDKINTLYFLQYDANLQEIAFKLANAI